MGQHAMTLVTLPGLHFDWHDATGLRLDNHTSRMSLTPISARNLKFIVLTGTCQFANQKWVLLCQFASRYANRTWKEFDFCLNAARFQYGYCAM